MANGSVSDVQCTFEGIDSAREGDQGCGSVPFAAVTLRHVGIYA